MLPEPEDVLPDDVPDRILADMGLENPSRFVPKPRDWPTARPAHSSHSSRITSPSPARGPSADGFPCPPDPGWLIGNRGSESERYRWDQFGLQLPVPGGSTRLSAASARLSNRTQVDVEGLGGKPVLSQIGEGLIVAAAGVRRRFSVEHQASDRRRADRSPGLGLAVRLDGVPVDGRKAGAHPVRRCRRECAGGHRSPLRRLAFGARLR